MRAFIAVHPGPELRLQVVEVIRQLEGAGRVKWVEADNLHFTIRFLGEVADTLVTPLQKALREAASLVPPFRITLEGLGAFPSVRRPQTLWAGLVAGQSDMARLNEGVEEGLVALGLPREARGFRAHLTLGRRREDRPDDRLRDLLQRLVRVPIGSSDIGHISLMQSVLGRAGPTYTHVLDVPLGIK